MNTNLKGKAAPTGESVELGTGSRPSRPEGRSSSSGPSRVRRLTAVIPALAIASAFAFGSVPAASAAVPATASLAALHSTSAAANVAAISPVTASAPAKVAPAARVTTSAWTYTASKTAAFARCIFLVGVPIGVAWEVAFNPAVWSWVAKGGALPASVGGTAARYLGWIKSSCGYALR